MAVQGLGSQPSPSCKLSCLEEAGSHAFAYVGAIAR